MTALKKGIFCAVAACVLWGTAFVAPIMLKGWNVWAVVGGRYLFYALVSVVALAALGHLHRTPLPLWRSSFALTMLGNAGYYPNLA